MLTESRFKKAFFFLVLFTAVCFSLFSFGRRERLSQPEAAAESPAIADTVNQVEEGNQNIVEIIGRIEIFGNNPHTFVGIVAEDGVTYSVYPPLIEEELRRLQGHLIEFTVTILDEPRGFGALLLGGGTVTPLSWVIKEDR